MEKENGSEKNGCFYEFETLYLWIYRFDNIYNGKCFFRTIKGHIEGSVFIFIRSLGVASWWCKKDNIIVGHGFSIITLSSN